MFWKCFPLANRVSYFVTCWLSWCGGMGRLDGAQGSRSRGEPQIMEWLRPSPRLFQTRALGHCSVMVCRMALRLSTRPRCWLQLLYSANTASTGLCMGGEALVVEITLQCISVMRIKLCMQYKHDEDIGFSWGQNPHALTNWTNPPPPPPNMNLIF